MLPEELAPVLRRLRRGPPKPSHPSTTATRNLGRAEIESLLPHRGGMLLLDGIDEIDLEAKTLRARRRISPEDPVFLGHFPQSPVYPGVLLTEMIGQAGLCLAPLVRPRRAEPRPRLIHVHHAGFLSPVLPGMTLTIHAELLDEGLTLVAAGQVFRGDTLCAYAVSEVYLDE
jgi:3-hydroxyacyl-[acyl-carrier-protein] dehydratase